MTVTLINLVTRAARRMPLTSVPTEVVDSTTPMGRQFLELAQEEGDDLRTRHEWSAMKTDWSFVVSADPHTQAKPTGFDRLEDKSRFWRSDSNFTSLAGPLTPVEWEFQQTLSQTFPGFWRRYQTGFQFLGVPVAETIRGSYISDQWVNDVSTGTKSETWTADDDTCIFPDRLMVLGIRWRWKQSKGLEYAQDFDDHENMVLQFIMQDTSIETICSSRPDAYPGKIAWSGTITPV